MKNITTRACAIAQTQLHVKLWHVLAVVLFWLLVIGSVIVRNNINHQQQRAMAQIDIFATQKATTIESANQYTWFTESLRAATAEWDDADGRYAWITNPLRDHGFSAAEVLDFCNRMDGFAAKAG